MRISKSISQEKQQYKLDSDNCRWWPVSLFPLENQIWIHCTEFLAWEKPQICSEIGLAHLTRDSCKNKILLTFKLIGSRKNCSLPIPIFTTHSVGVQCQISLVLKPYCCPFTTVVPCSKTEVSSVYICNSQNISLWKGVEVKLSNRASFWRLHRDWRDLYNKCCLKKKKKVCLALRNSSNVCDQKYL